MRNKQSKKSRKSLLSTRRPIPHYSPFPSSGEREKEGGRLPQDIMNKTARKKGKKKKKKKIEKIQRKRKEKKKEKD